MSGDLYVPVCTIDGVQVPIGPDWTASAVANGGYDQAQVSVESDVARRLSDAGQGSVLTLWLSDTRKLWEGRLGAPLDIKRSTDLTKIPAQGHVLRAHKRSDRLLYQSMDYRLWADGAASPFADANTGAWAVHVNPNSLQLTDSDTANVGSGFLDCYIPTQPGGIRRVAFSALVVLGVGAPVITVALLTRDGATGALTQVASGTAIDQTVGLGHDCVVIKATNTAVAGGNATVTISNLKVGGRAITDAMLDSDVVDDVATLLGFDSSGVQGGFMQVLPLDWTGGDWTGLLDLMASYTDYRWRVLGDNGAGPLMEYGPWGQQDWAINSQNGSWDLSPLEIFNGIVVNWIQLSGAPAQVIALPAVDPLAGTGVQNYLRIDIPGPRTDATLANALAQSLLDTITTQRWQGTITVTRPALGADGSMGRYEILPGDTATVTDFDDNTATTHRIHQATYTATSVQLGVEMPVSFAAMLAILANQATPTGARNLTMRRTQ